MRMAAGRADINSEECAFLLFHDVVMDFHCFDHEIRNRTVIDLKV